MLSLSLPLNPSQSSPPTPACDIIQARCNDVDNETMDSSTHTPTAPIRLKDKRRFTLSQNIELSPWWVLFSLCLSHWHSLLPTTPRTRPQIARHIIIVVFNLCAPKEIANTACPALSAALQTWITTQRRLNRQIRQYYIRWIVYPAMVGEVKTRAFSRCPPDGI